MSACSEAPSSSDVRPYYVATVKIDPSMTEADIIAKYGGDIVLLKPEAGFAVLAFNQKEGELSTLATTTANQNSFSAPEVSASGSAAWGGGSAAWGGGWSAWSGGWSAWSGGFSAWSGGVSDGGPANNRTAWEHIKLREAHAISRNFGEGIVVAVIDTGIDLNHPMFAGRLVASSQWRDFIDNDYYPMEASSGSGRGHGTAVASIILQIAPKAKIMPIRVLDAFGNGDTDDVAKAIDWAVTKGAHVINMSLGTHAHDYTLFEMATYANNRGLMIFASSGNDGGFGTMTQPGTYGIYNGPYMKTVGIASINPNRQLSSFSSYGDELYGAAPGESIQGAFPGSQSASFKGTSFATPMFTGAAALALGEMSSVSARANLSDYMSNSLDWQFAQSIGIPGARLLNVEQLIRSLPGFSEPQYLIRSVQSNKCLEVSGANTSNGGNIDQLTCTSTNLSHRWKLKPVGDYYQIINVNSGRVADVSGISYDNGASIHQWSYGGGNNQKWQVLTNGDGSFSFRVVHSGKCMDVYGGSSADGANIVQWGCHGGNNQKWRIQLAN
ncbi:MAG: S8 family serine peptidase [Deinococcales bacterium]